MNRNFGLDLLRTISIWLVLLQHGGINIIGLIPLKIGGIGVEIFFVLSGFLIGGILLRDLEKKMSLKETLIRFWTRRWFRILPLYFLILIFKFTFIDHSIGYNIIYYFLFLQNNFYGIQYFEVSWSLVIEEWFYLFIPIFLIICNKIFKTNRGMLISFILFILFINLIRFIYVIHGNVPYQGINGNFPFRFDSLFVGVILAYFKHKNMQIFNQMKSKFILFIGLILFIGYIYFYWTRAYPVNLINQNIFIRTIGFFILPFTIGLLIPYVSAITLNYDNSVLKKIVFKFITSTSIYTYSIYLTHTFIYSLILNNNRINNPTFEWIIAIGLLYLVSWIIYQYFEKPILTYRDKITQTINKLETLSK